MKHPALLIIILAAVFTSAAAGAQTLAPEAYPPADGGKLTGLFCAEFADTDRMDTDGALTARLFTPDRYPAAAVEALAPGDTAVVGGETFHVEEVVFHEPAWEDETGAYEILTTETYFGGIWFEQADGEAYSAYMDDCMTCSYFMDLTIPLPLPATLEYVYFNTSEGDETLPAEELLASLRDPDEADGWTRYNTTLTMREGIPVQVHHQAYPLSPDAMDQVDDEV